MDSRTSKAPKVELRIDSKTVLLVSREKCNEAYAKKVRARMAKSHGPASMKYLDF